MNMEKFKKFFSELKIMDWVIIGGIVLALIVGLFTFLRFRQTANRQIEAKSMVGFQIFFRSITLTGNVAPIKPGDDTFISIRNVPCTNLKVADIKIDTKKVIMPNPNAGKEKFIMVEDVSQLFSYDMVVTLIADAKITKDGAVIGGNKIKIGLPVTLEGPNYKLNGTVSDISILPPNLFKQKTQVQEPEKAINKKIKQNVPHIEVHSQDNDSIIGPDKDGKPKLDVIRQDKNVG